MLFWKYPFEVPIETDICGHHNDHKSLQTGTGDTLGSMS